MMSTKPKSLDTMYTFDRLYHSIQCSLPMWRAVVCCGVFVLCLCWWCGDGGRWCWYVLAMLPPNFYTNKTVTAVFIYIRKISFQKICSGCDVATVCVGPQNPSSALRTFVKIKYLTD